MGFEKKQVRSSISQIQGRSGDNKINVDTVVGELFGDSLGNEVSRRKTIDSEEHALPNQSKFKRRSLAAPRPA